MIAMGDDHDIEPCAGEQIDQRRRHPVRNGQHRPAVQAQRGDVRDGSDGRHQRGQPGIRQAERIAARQDDFVDRRIAGNQRQRLGLTRTGEHDAAIIRVAAEAVAAVDGAGAGRDQQRPATILAQNAGRGAIIGLRQRIGEAARLRQGLLAARQHLQQQRISRIAAPDQRQIVRRHGQREVRVCHHASREICCRQPDPHQQFGRGEPGGAGLRLPVFSGRQRKGENGGHGDSA